MKNLDDILKGTSRAFYLSLKALPKRSREPMSLAYLLARAADTIADSDCEPNTDRKATLQRLSVAISDPSQELPNLGRYHPLAMAERELLNIVDELLEQLHGKSALVKSTIQLVITTLISGMIWDQDRFDKPEESNFEGLSDEEFENYTYLVAGCVGPFWSKICVFGNPRLQILLRPRNLDVAERFGKALQYVNILRDVPADQANQRYYLPKIGRSDFSRRFVAHAHHALQHFRQALLYPELFETWNLRDKIAVFLPLVIGMRTLEQLFISGLPRPNTRIKVQRFEVLLWLALAPAIVLVPVWLSKTLNYMADRAESALSQMEKTL